MSAVSGTGVPAAAARPRLDADMRRRILGVAVLSVVVAVLLFGLPLAFAVGRLFYDEERSELERVALRGAEAMPADVRASGALRLPTVDSAVHVAVYGLDGTRLSGDGPPVADLAVRGALHGRITDERSGSVLVVAVPATSSDRVVGVVRATSSAGEVRGRVWGTWAGMTVLALLAVAAASAFAAVQARRLARPLQELEAVAEDLGAGNFSSRAAPSGVGEIDRTGQALNRTAQRLDDMLARERAFTARASHQLRTPLTRLRLVLETALHGDADLQAATREAIGSADQLSRTIDDVLALSRGVAGDPQGLDVAGLLAGLRDRWQQPLAAAGRTLSLVEEPHPPASASEPAVRQILDVLLDNAFRHGAGQVTVTARGSGDALAIDVSDEGRAPGDRSLVPGPDVEEPPPEGGHRLGLRMASSLALGSGGRLVHAHTEARTRMTLLLPPPE